MERRCCGLVGGGGRGERTEKLISPIFLSVLLNFAKRAKLWAKEGIRLQVLCVPSSKAHNEGSVPMIGGCFAIFCESISMRWVDAYCVDEEPR